MKELFNGGRDTEAMKCRALMIDHLAHRNKEIEYDDWLTNDQPAANSDMFISTVEKAIATFAAPVSADSRVQISFDKLGIRRRHPARSFYTKHTPEGTY